MSAWSYYGEGPFPGSQSVLLAVSSHGERGMGARLGLLYVNTSYKFATKPRENYSIGKAIRTNIPENGSNYNLYLVQLFTEFYVFQYMDDILSKYRVPLITLMRHIVLFMLFV